MIIATSFSEIDQILDHFIAEGFEAPTMGFQPGLENWREWLKEEHLAKNKAVIFDPVWVFEPRNNGMRKILRWYDGYTFGEYLKKENNDEEINA